MKKLKPTKRVGMVLLTMCLLWLVACKRNELQPPTTPSVLNTYRGTDKMVLQVIETIKEPENKDLLAELEKQGSINWEYKVFITSRFLKGYTLRFATGSNDDYLDAELNAETKAIKLFSKQQQEQKDAMAQQAFSKRPGLNSTQAGMCTFKISFEIELDKEYDIIVYVFHDILIPMFFDALKKAGFQDNGQGLTYMSEKTTAKVDALLRRMLASIFRPGSIIAASFTYLEIENSCESVEGDNPNVSPIVGLQQVAPSSGLAYNVYGAVIREQVAIVLGCYKEGGVWKGLVKKITGSYSVQVRLLPGVTEITGPHGNTNVANFCKQVEDMRNFGEKNARWYTIRAVQAHENVHVTRLLPKLNEALPQIKTLAQSFTAPGSLSYSDALVQIKGMAWDLNNSVKDIWSDHASTQAKTDHDPGQACQIAEGNIVNPMIDYICNFSKTQTPAWPSCTFCP